MKIDVLRLLAFGPFTDLVIDLSRCPSGLHVLYGDNAAGKSTTLRAVSGLLYGIPRDTVDAYQHRMTDLRVGATLSASDGTVLEIVRRKGNVRTLLDPKGAPVDEGPLRRLLAGVDEKTFANLFGLDHAALRRGGDALLSGGGDVGESLFEAGSGVGGLHALLEELRAKADALWTPQAKKRPLNEALDRFHEARKAARNDALSHDAWVAQEKALAEKREEHARVAEERRALELRYRWLLRARHVRPLLATRRAAVAERAALGTVAALPEGAADERRDAQHALAAAQSTLERLGGPIDQIERALLALGPSAAAPPPGTAQRVADLGARLQAGAEDLGRRQGEVGRLEREVRARAEQLGSAATAGRLDVAKQAGLREVAAEGSALQARTAEIERRLADVERRARALEERWAEQAPARDVAAVDRALARARREGDLPARLDAARADLARVDASACACAAMLAPWRGSLDEAARIRRPDGQTIARAASRADEIENDARVLAGEEARAHGRVVAAEEQMAVLLADGQVPDANDLEVARATRDGSWARVRAAWAAGDRGAEAVLGPAHERTVRGADDVSDRLRLDAARVTRLAALRAERDAARAALERLAATREELERRRAQADAQWKACWAATGIAPLDPADMRDWCARHDRLLEVLAGRAEVNRQVGTLEALARALAVELGAALGLDDTGTADVADLVAEAAALVESERGRANRRESLAEARADARAEQDVAAEEQLRHSEVLAAWRGRWAAAVTALGLDGGAGIATALDVLEALRELWAKQEEAASLRRACDEIGEATRGIEQDLRTAIAAHAPDLDASDLAQAAPRLVDRLRAADERARERVGLDRELAERRAEQASARDLAAAAQARLDALRAVANAPDLPALEEAERRWAAARELDRRIAESATQLVAAGEGASVDELEATFGALDADRIAAEIADIESTLPDLEERARDLDFTARGIQSGLDGMHAEARAVTSAEDAQVHLARARELTRRWAELRLAAVVLEREIEAYRERNQAPVLSRASDLFRLLAGPEFRALRAGWSAERKDRLECIAADGQPLEVHELSEGLRDAVYLALRLASVERALGAGEPLPLVLDDVLIQMDDRHVRAALQALAEVAKRTQVLFFTHNEHIVSIARDVLGEPRVCVHRLIRAVTVPAPEVVSG